MIPGDLILANHTENIGTFRADCSTRIAELKHAIRQAMNQQTVDGETCTPAYAQKVRTDSKREIHVLHLMDSMLACIEESVDQHIPARLRLTPMAYMGLDKLLYPMKRQNKRRGHDNETTQR